MKKVPQLGSKRMAEQASKVSPQSQGSEIWLKSGHVCIRFSHQSHSTCRLSIKVLERYSVSLDK